MDDNVTIADPNFIADNIRNGYALFGIIGTLNPLREASGTTFVSTATASFSMDNGTTYSINYISISGLSFKPKIIVAKGPSDATIYLEGKNFSSSYNNSPILLHLAGYQLVGNASVTETGFLLPILANGINANWYAYG